MLVKFENEGNTEVILSEIDIETLSTEAGKKEAEVEKEKYVPTQDDLDRLEEELKRVNEQKFGSLEGPTGSDGPDDSSLGDGIKRLSYTRRDA